MLLNPEGGSTPVSFTRPHANANTHAPFLTVVIAGGLGFELLAEAVVRVASSGVVVSTPRNANPTMPVLWLEVPVPVATAVVSGVLPCTLRYTMVRALPPLNDKDVPSAVYPLVTIVGVDTHTDPQIITYVTSPGCNVGQVIVG